MTVKHILLLSNGKVLEAFAIPYRETFNRHTFTSKIFMDSYCIYIIRNTVFSILGLELVIGIVVLVCCTRRLSWAIIRRFCHCRSGMTQYKFHYAKVLLSPCTPLHYFFFTAMVKSLYLLLKDFRNNIADILGWFIFRLRLWTPSRNAVMPLC